MRLALHALLALLAPVLVQASCIDPALPEGARISCESDAGCPPGTSCAAALERCVDANADREAPALEGETAPAPAAGEQGTTFTLTIVANERLGRVPEVTASIERIALPPFVRESDDDGEDGDGRTYRFSYTAGGDEPEGIALINVTLVDEFGNLADLAGGAFRLDFNLPSLLESDIIEGAVATAGTTVVVTATFDEPLLEDPILFLAPEPYVFMTPQSPGSNVFSYTVIGDELDGLRFLVAKVIDLAGNENTIELNAGAVLFDFDAPQPSGGGGLDSTVQGANDLFLFTLEFDELILEQADLGDGELTPVPAATATLRGGVPGIDTILLEVQHSVALREGEPVSVVTFSHRVRECDTEGVYDIVIDDVFDGAGNEVDGLRQDGWDLEIGGLTCK